MFMRWSLPKLAASVQYRTRLMTYDCTEFIYRRFGAARRITDFNRHLPMQLPDKAISYQYQSLLAPALEDWTPLAELRAEHLLPQHALRDFQTRLSQVKSQVAAERELKMVPPELLPLDAGFIDLPQKTL